MAHTFLRNDGQFQQVNGGDIGISTTTTTGFLSYISAVATTNSCSSSTSVFVIGAQVAQGSSGIWLVQGWVTVSDTAGGRSYATQISDGTNVVAYSQNTSSAATFDQQTFLSGVIASPAGNLQIGAKPIIPVTSFTLYSSNSGGGCGIVAIRIG